MINVTGIAFTGYPITDVPRARAFYEGLLGLKTGTIWEHGSSFWIEYDIGPATLAISNMSQDMWKPSPDGPSVALEVGNFDGAVATLRDGGVRFVVEPMDSGGCQMAIVADPDGNSVILHHRKST